MSASQSESRTALHFDLNGEARTLNGPCTISDLLEQLELGGKRVAVALNRQVIARSRYAKIEVTEHDRIEILEAVGGG
jgi:sulfur carrier protein